MEAKEKGDTLTAEMLSRRNIAFFDSANAIKRAFIMAHPHSLAGMKAASEYLSMDCDDMRSLHDALAGSPYRHSSLYRSFDSRYRELAGKWMQDRRAPGFTTRDAAGREVSLSDFRGRYVLLDFWASWCVPCRAKMKELKRVYPQLKDKGIEVVSISMDEKRGAWLQASSEDGVEWVNTCDAVPFADNKIGQAYKVTAVPALFVVSPQGYIIAQNPTIDFLLSLGSQ